MIKSDHQEDNMKVAAAKFDICIASALYIAGNSCDGYPHYAEVFYITATDGSGNRYALNNARFRSFKVVNDEDTDGENVFLNIRDSAMSRAQRIVDRINAAGMIDLDNWTETKPAYGSVAYQRLDNFLDTTE